MSKTPRRLTIDQAQGKVRECRDLASKAKMKGHRIMLEHMAETWERVVISLQRKTLGP
jgi:hypothetical protein